MGIKEFRERISELSLGAEVVIVTHHGKRVGRYIPEPSRKPAENIGIEEWAEERKRFAREWRARTPDWRERLAAAGIPPEEIDD
ncbi:MAG TPA: hypothetical protein VES64_07465 [Allosphingosinicella sp.]|nr:hypothetical protein [Allosphingosinicella sp.]